MGKGRDKRKKAKGGSSGQGEIKTAKKTEKNEEKATRRAERRAEVRRQDLNRILAAHLYTGSRGSASAVTHTGSA